MRLALPLLLLLPAGLLAQERNDAFNVHLSLRVVGGVLDPDHPFRATGAVGGAAGVHGDHFGVVAAVIHQRQTLDASNDLKEKGRTFYGVIAEYSVAGRRRYERTARVELGAGRLARGSYRSVSYVNGGAALRYPVTSRFAFVGHLNDYIAFLPSESGPRGPMNQQVQHNFAGLVTLELDL